EELLKFAGEDFEKYYDGWQGYPMKPRIPGLLFCLVALSTVAWVAGRDTKPTRGWIEVAPGVLRSPGSPFGYALVADDHALLIDAPCGPEGLGGKTIDAVLLTHHHRDTAAYAGNHLAAGVPVRASKASAEWLTPASVRKYWQESLPLRNSRTAYLVLP